MNRSETAALLAIAASFDRRTVGETDVVAWHAIVENIDFEDAKCAITKHYSRSREWLMPADVLGEVLRVRRSRIEHDGDAVLAAVDPDDVDGWLHALRDNRRRVAQHNASAEHHRSVTR